MVGLKEKNLLAIVAWGVLLTLSYWLGFYANEKATAVPVMISVLATMLVLLKDEMLMSRCKHLCAVYIFSLLAFLSYFVFRFAVLGKVVGGYDDRLLNPDQLTPAFLLGWLVKALTLPFWQMEYSDYVLVSCLCLPLIFFICLFIYTDLLKNRSRFRRYTGERL